jgi:divalent metal cation (Fe/Co/Zn/Cd) transporter
VQSTVVLAIGYHPRHFVLGIIWTAVTATAMFILAAGKARTGRALDNPVLRTEGRVTMIDGILAAAVLLGLILNAALGWWQADPAAGYVLVYYAAREVRKSSPQMTETLCTPVGPAGPPHALGAAAFTAPGGASRLHGDVLVVLGRDGEG